VGGSHVTAAAVDLGAARILAGTRRRLPLRPDTDAETFLTALTEAAGGLPPEIRDATWGIAVPGPFDYATGIARYRGVGKFSALDGLAVAEALAGRLRLRPARLRFLSDAVAFALGARRTDDPRPRRMVAVTLGTGIGSAFLDEGAAVTEGPQVPPEGRLDLLAVDGGPLEDTVSTRAMAGRYTSRTGQAVDGVRGLAELAGHGDATARAVVESALHTLGAALAPWLLAFRADALAVGGSMTAAWPLLGPPFRTALAEHAPALARLPVRVHHDGETPALLGAALYAAQAHPRIHPAG
jgi:glucokinase